MGDMTAAKLKLRALRTEREHLARNLASARMDLPTVEELMPLPREKLADLRATLQADLPQGRLTLGALLGDRRIRVYRDGRIDGEALLAPETIPAAKRTSRPGVSVVAGGRYARVSLPGPLALPVSGRAA
jgi:hypothetical protein